VDHSQKILLAGCILVAIFLSTNLMLVPLLRRRRDTHESQTMKALGNLLKPTHNSGQDAMEELGRRVEKLKQEQPPKGDDEV
jgi:hypothetical protein